MRNNSALVGGGISFEDNSIVNLTRCSFEQCSSETSAGAIYATNHAAPSFYYCNISANIAGSVGAGGVLAAFSQPDFYECDIRYQSFSKNLQTYL